MQDTLGRAWSFNFNQLKVHVTKLHLCLQHNIASKLKICYTKLLQKFKRFVNPKLPNWPIAARKSQIMFHKKKAQRPHDFIAMVVNKRLN